MKRKSVTIMAVLFACALFAGQALAQQQQTTTMMGGQESMQSQNIHRASEIIGQNVQNQQGEDLGEIEEVVFDQQGNISYIVLSKKGIMGMGGEMIPIPWQAADLSGQKENLVLNIEKEKLDQAPTFKEGEWNNLEEQNFQQQVRGYYGTGAGMEGMQGMEHQQEGQRRKY